MDCQKVMQRFPLPNHGLMPGTPLTLGFCVLQILVYWGPCIRLPNLHPPPVMLMILPAYVMPGCRWAASRDTA